MTLRPVREALAADVLKAADPIVADPAIVAEVVREVVGELVAGLNAQQKKSLKRLTERSQANEWTEEELARRVNDVVGLDDRSRNAVEAMRQRLIDQGVPRGTARTTAQKYANTLRRERAVSIARNEVSHVMAVARRRTWLKARDDGDIPNYSVRIWRTHKDDRNCPVCRNMNGQRAALDGVFMNGHAGPPAHPNAVLSGSLFAPYGGVTEMVSSKYNGPAVTIVSGTKRLTIGPNHPVLTTRGLVRAYLVNEGDQLIYDKRFDGSSTVRESNLEKVHSVEDSFDSLWLGSSDTFVATSGYDFHGDSEWCDEEVKVVRPEGGLLDELDPSGLQHVCKNNLMRAYTESDLATSYGPLLLGDRAVLLSTPGSVSGNDTSGAAGSVVAQNATFGTLVALTAALDADVFVAHTVDAITMGWIKCEAFDASTETGWYSSDGFVVTNCRCVEELVLGQEVIGKKDPRDDDGDGFVDDGTPMERPATKEGAVSKRQSIRKGLMKSLRRTGKHQKPPVRFDNTPAGYDWPKRTNDILLLEPPEDPVAKARQLIEKRKKEREAT